MPGQGAVMVCDGRVTHTGHIVTDIERKFVRCGSTTVLVAGEIGPTWRGLQMNPPKKFAEFLNTVDCSDDDCDWLAYDRRTDSLWVGNNKIGHVFAALGSGDALALGALEAMPLAKTLSEAESAAQRAVKITCKRHSECGGRIRTIVVPRKGQVVVR